MAKIALQNKTVFITGASSGIGQACARAFAAEGARLLLCARRLDRLATLVPELMRAGAPEVHAFVLDVRQREAVQRVLSSLPEAWQAVDILVNNAGLAAGLDTVYAGDILDWDAMIDTNVKGLLYVTREIVPQMVARNTGHIINLGSIAGHQVYPKGAVYCATKHAVKAVSEGLKQDLLGTQVRVTSVDPGAVETEFSLVRFKGDSELAAKVYEGILPLQAEDIADAILYCASRPMHVNVNELILMPTAQASATLMARKTES